MPRTLSPEVIQAFVSSLESLFYSATGVRGELGSMALTTERPPPPYVEVTIHLKGSLVGPVHCTFGPVLAQDIASHMLNGLHAPEFDTPACRDALAELANVLVGSATGTLSNTGLPVELAVPKTRLAEATERSRDDALRVTLMTGAGPMDLLLDVRMA